MVQVKSSEMGGWFKAILCPRCQGSGIAYCCDGEDASCDAVTLYGDQASTSSDRFLTFKQAVRHSFKNGYIAGNPCELAEITTPDLDEEKINWTIAACAKVQFSTLEKIVKYCAPEDRLKIIFAA